MSKIVVAFIFLLVPFMGPAQQVEVLEQFASTADVTGELAVSEIIKFAPDDNSPVTFADNWATAPDFTDKKAGRNTGKTLMLTGAAMIVGGIIFHAIGRTKSCTAQGWGNCEPTETTIGVVLGLSGGLVLLTGAIVSASSGKQKAAD